MNSILMAYATKHGSTREVADAVAATLREGGAKVDVRLAARVRGLVGYDLVVLRAERDREPPPRRCWLNERLLAERGFTD